MPGAESLRRKKKSGRFYVWPPTQPHELEVPSVTTIIGGGIPKDALKWWSAKVAAEYAVAHVESWQGLPEGDAIDLIKRAHTRITYDRAAEGSAVHAALEGAAMGSQFPLEGLEPKAQGMYEGARKFLDEHVKDIYQVETPVYSRRYQYAGTPDLFATVEIPGREWPVFCVVDYKTSKAIYDETAIQLCALGRADFIGTRQGVEIVFDPPETGITVRPTYDGKFEAQAFHLTDELFDLFLHARGVWNRNKVFKDTRAESFGDA